VIELDLSNIELVARLKLKLQEYDERLAKHKADNPYKDSQVLKDEMLGTIYRKRLIEELLKTGSVMTWELSRTLEREDGGVDRHRFENSCGVIGDYIETGGATNQGGLLPQLVD
jgi:hypothetical protein